MENILKYNVTVYHFTPPSTTTYIALTHPLKQQMLHPTHYNNLIPVIHIRGIAGSWQTVTIWVSQRKLASFGWTGIYGKLVPITGYAQIKTVEKSIGHKRYCIPHHTYITVRSHITAFLTIPIQPCAVTSLHSSLYLYNRAQSTSVMMYVHDYCVLAWYYICSVMYVHDYCVMTWYYM
jgi:hypothetical protein